MSGDVQGAAPEDPSALFVDRKALMEAMKKRMDAILADPTDRAAGTDAAMLAIAINHLARKSTEVHATVVERLGRLEALVELLSCRSGSAEPAQKAGLKSQPSNDDEWRSTAGAAP